MQQQCVFHKILMEAVADVDGNHDGVLLLLYL